MPDWRDPSYLRDGSPAQRTVYEFLVRSELLRTLSAWDPVLVGTFPLDIAVEGSDLDFVCEASETTGFCEALFAGFSNQQGFVMYSRTASTPTAIVCRFVLERMPVEIFASPVSSESQWAYRHMVQEWRVLSIAGENFAEAVRACKRSGEKTEPAFAKLLGLEGDPYESILRLEAVDDSGLAELIECRANACL